jgi:hypothetical protein
MTKKIKWPEGKSFAFTIVDDTDNATLESIQPIYDCLHELGMYTTKTVWVFKHEEERYGKTDTLERKEYLDYILKLKDAGFEIGFHCARGSSSKRELTLKALEVYKEKLGSYPAMHINHAQNKENLYWTFNRLFKIQQWLHRMGIKKYPMRGTGYGADEKSEYFWGDFVKENIRYVRSNTFDEINILNKDPYTPYYEKRFKYVNAWFTSSHTPDGASFIEMIKPENQQKLLRENGLCIMYTHFGEQGFLDENGQLNPLLKERLKQLSELNGWFVPATTILDYIVAQRGVTKVNSWMQWLRVRK